MAKLRLIPLYWSDVLVSAVIAGGGVAVVFCVVWFWYLSNYLGLAVALFNVASLGVALWKAHAERRAREAGVPL